MQDFNIHISTLNGTGSYFANQVLTRMIFRSGYFVGSYNFFPSNIAGLPCIYTIRVNSKGHTAYKPLGDLLIQLNSKTLLKDVKYLQPSGTLVIDEKDISILEANAFKGHVISLPFSKSVTQFKNVTSKTKKLLRNMIYVGLISEWLCLDKKIIEKTLKSFFSNKPEEILMQNLQAFQIGVEMARSQSLSYSPSEVKPQKNNVLMSGNEAVALGALFSGCQFLSWYPITPATSVAESFEKWACLNQKDQEGKKTFVVHQSEDEISALGQVIGAGWSGLRAMTVTSGPGLSLMSEGAGLSYFAEVPAVICNVQRAGPSTGLPTRTQQGDLLSSCFLSHGDAKHIVLMLGNLEEAFSLTQKAFELSDYLQTLIIILTDLDLGMNLHASPSFQIKETDIKKGKILSEEDLNKTDFYRYDDKDGDGISYRTLPGVAHPKGAYFTRGSGHNKKAEYSESPTDYENILNKLNKKWRTAQALMPEPIQLKKHKTPYALVTFGNNEKACKEAQEELEKENIKTNFLRIRSYPFSDSIKSFLKSHLQIFVVEQNRDGQLKQLLSSEFPEEAGKMRSILQYDGRPFFKESICKQFKELKR